MKTEELGSPSSASEEGLVSLETSPSGRGGLDPGNTPARAPVPFLQEAVHGNITVFVCVGVCLTSGCPPSPESSNHATLYITVLSATVDRIISSWTGWTGTLPSYLKSP